MTSSRRARRRRRQFRTARRACREPRLEAWQLAVSAYTEAFRQATAISWTVNYIKGRYSSLFQGAAMSSLGGYDDRFAEHDEETLALGSLTGIRYWSMSAPFRDDTGQPMVQLRGARGRWLPGENTAVCLSAGGFGQHQEEQVPTRGCGCGFWAYWAPDPYGGTSYVTDPSVTGMIRGWGRYRAGTKGFRCAKAKLLAVCVQPGFRSEQWRVAAEEALAATYQVPVYSSIETMLKAFPPSRAPKEESREYNAGWTFPGGATYTVTVGPGGGGSVSGGGYTSGGTVYYTPAAHTVQCPCGTNWALAAGAYLTCQCGAKWTWNGLAPAMYTPPATPADVLKQLEQKKNGLITWSVTWEE